MTDQEINVAIAEVCGWTVVRDFCNNIHAMRNAEDSLSDSGFVKYLQALTSLQKRQLMDSATARQRAEAFLRTLGRWKE